MNYLSIVRRGMVLSTILSIFVITFSPIAVAKSRLEKRQERFWKKFERQLDYVEKRLKKHFDDFGNSDSFYIHQDAWFDVNFEKKFAVEVVSQREDLSHKEKLLLMAAPEYREQVRAAIKNEIKAKGSFKKYYRRTIFSWRARLCLVRKVGLGILFGIPMIAGSFALIGGTFGLAFGLAIGDLGASASMIGYGFLGYLGSLGGFAAALSGSKCYGKIKN